MCGFRPQEGCAGGKTGTAHKLAESDSMRAALHFILPEDQGEFDAALLGRKALTALWDIDQHCRGILKHGEPSEELARLCKELRAMIPPELLEV